MSSNDELTDYLQHTAAPRSRQEKVRMDEILLFVDYCIEEERKTGRTISLHEFRRLLTE
jgi:hypothetical protein